MSEYRKKPVVIEAEQYVGPQMIFKDEPRPAVPEGVTWHAFDITFDLYPCVETLEGKMLVRPGDWIITGVQGERYPCKPDIFAATYEPADAPAPAPADWIVKLRQRLTEYVVPAGGVDNVPEDCVVVLRATVERLVDLVAAPGAPTKGASR